MTDPASASTETASVVSLADRAETLLRERLGVAPDGVWFAPGRVNLIGEHTDYNDGFVLPLALEEGTAVAVARRSDGKLRLVTTQDDVAVTVAAGDLRPGNPPGWAGYAAGVVWAADNDGVSIGGLDIAVAGNLPLGAGLSSSASLECALATALNDLASAGRDRTALARLARSAENDFVGMPCGVMDQMASMHGRVNSLVFLDTRTLVVEHVPVDLEVTSTALLVIDTRAPHRLVDGAYAQRRATCMAAADALGVAALRDVTDTGALDALTDPVMRRRAQHVVTENQRVLDVVHALRDGRPPQDVGPMLTASHVSLRDDYEVSVPELDVAVEAARDAGAFGARMTGGGFGGSVVALLPADRAEAVTSAVHAAAARHGFATPDVFSVRPAAGARRIR